MGDPFPGEDKLTGKQDLAYSRKAIDRCWRQKCWERISEPTTTICGRIPRWAINPRRSMRQAAKKRLTLRASRLLAVSIRKRSPHNQPTNQNSHKGWIKKWGHSTLASGLAPAKILRLARQATLSDEKTESCEP